jgi:hypothetical protein
LAESQELSIQRLHQNPLWIVNGARHQDLLAYDPSGYETRVMQFLEGAFKPVGYARNVQN